MRIDRRRRGAFLGTCWHWRRSVMTLGLALSVLATGAQPVAAQDQLCDTAYQDCRHPLWVLLDAETVGVDVAFWAFDDFSLSNKLVALHSRGIPVRVLMDPRVIDAHPSSEAILYQLRDAGIPMRYKVDDGILHWKMMLFVGQNRVEFSSANFGIDFGPMVPYEDYIDEIVYFTSDPPLISSFKTKYDDLWTDTIRYGNYASISGPLTRRYGPPGPIHPDLSFPPGSGPTFDEFATRVINHDNLETQRIDIAIFRLFDQRHTSALIDAINRGVPVRMLVEPREYRRPTKRWHSWNVDRLFMAGAQIKNRRHAGDMHEKLSIFYSQGLAVFGSSNYTSSSSYSQEEHNYFTTKPALLAWLMNHYNRKWSSASEFEPFVPLPPDPPIMLSPANGATGQPTATVTLTWEGGLWAHKYDLYFGTSPDPPLIAADVEAGSIEDEINETYPVSGLLGGTTYYWRIVGKTMALQATSGPVWSFTTVNPPGAPDGLTLPPRNPF